VSVVIPVTYFKTTGKRVFRMAPIHHHFENGGWAETTVVIRFWLLAALAAMTGFGLFYGQWLTAKILSTRDRGPTMSTDSILQPQSAVDILRSREVFVAGAGVAGKGIVAMLEGIGGRFKVVDDRAQTADLNTVEAIAAVSSTETAPALLITSPGWRPDSELLLAAQDAGVPVIGDIEAAWLADQAGAFGAPRTWIAITGTNGKTTATAMATAMLQAAGLAAVS